MLQLVVVIVVVVVVVVVVGPFHVWFVVSISTHPLHG
jgi:hypothetical protein